MISSRSRMQKGVWLIGIAGLAVMTTWVFQNRATLAAACLRTVNGISSKVAHLNEPFGAGTAVRPKNPVLGIVPDFSLTERSGRNVQKSDLLGGYWVASFIFTRCATSCPIASSQFTKLQADLPEEVSLVSFTVDPDYDSPEVLSEYAKSYRADPDRWLFLTGEKNALYKNIREGFHLTVESNADAPAGFAVTHTPRFALVDDKGRIRGYYGSSEPEDMIRLRKDVMRLLKKDTEHS